MTEIIVLGTSIIAVASLIGGIELGRRITVGGYELGWRAGHAARGEVEVEEIFEPKKDPAEFAVLDEQAEQEPTNVITE